MRQGLPGAGNSPSATHDHAEDPRTRMFIFAKLLRAVKQKLSSSTVPFVHCTDRALTAVLEEAVRELTALRGTVGPLRWARRFLQGAKVIALGIIHWRRPPSRDQRPSVRFQRRRRTRSRYCSPKRLKFSTAERRLRRPFPLPGGGMVARCRLERSRWRGGRIRVRELSRG